MCRQLDGLFAMCRDVTILSEGQNYSCHLLQDAKQAKKDARKEARKEAEPKKADEASIDMLDIRSGLKKIQQCSADLALLISSRQHKILCGMLYLYFVVDLRPARTWWDASCNMQSCFTWAKIFLLVNVSIILASRYVQQGSFSLDGYLSVGNKPSACPYFSWLVDVQ